ncbi:(Fe-S)-cluster assembly protein OS=Streptomyces antimycoticus OX=68175 GN=SANT12839_083120 PE=4 SV=1 [Streptomyces antimycoticus]
MADITGPESLDKVRAHKQELKRQAKQAKDGAAG